MASVILIDRTGKTTGSDIDYSIIDGRVRSFEHNGKVLYDEDNKIETEGWKEHLIKVVEKARLNSEGIMNDKKNTIRGFHKFVLVLAEEGSLELKE